MKIGEEEYEDNYEFSKEEIAELEKDREEYLRGEGKSYTWEEVKAIILAGKGKSLELQLQNSMKRMLIMLHLVSFYCYYFIFISFYFFILLYFFCY